LGERDIVLPLIPARVRGWIAGDESPAPAGAMALPRSRKPGDRGLQGEGSADVGASPQTVWDMLLDPNTLQAVIPGCHSVEKISATHFRAEVTLGIGPVQGKYRAEVKLSDLDPPHAVTLSGSADGALGHGAGEGRITLVPREGGGTTLTYKYDAEVGGKVASIGGRLLDGATRVIIGQFFNALAHRAGGGEAVDGAPTGLWTRLCALFGVAR
ncbi:MAG: SRPBCC family protein, partial [Xanthobacteraceae bacterium]